MFDDVHTSHNAAGDDYFKRQDETIAAMGQDGQPVDAASLDSEKNRALHRKLLSWFYQEREKQSVNRMEMAMDADFYDNIQWDEQDAEDLRARGQMPLVYNEVAPMVDWLIGTERRTRIDWKVLPRTEDDVKAADVKTKVLKYVSDINRSAFARSRAFGDAVKSGLGWVDSGSRDDPTKDVLYNKYEDWRRVLYDSSATELDLSDGRYLFRWAWVDEDLALAMYPERANQIRMACKNGQGHDDTSENEDDWQTKATPQTRASGQLYASGTGVAADSIRRRVKIIECQYRMPVKTQVVKSGPLKGSIVHPDDTALQNALAQVGGSIVDRLMMRVHVAVMTENALLAAEPSIYRHNRFSLTPIWCYRRSRDRMPYGVIRRVRDIQMDLNKRASKALFMLNTNQIIADEGAVDDWDQARDEVDRPDGVVVKKAGKEFKIHRDTDAATGQLQIMAMDAQIIQKSAGVAQENMGRQTNAVSGEAIKARQTQGSVVTTEPFDNLRLATQIDGENQLSLCEQFYTEDKVIRLTGAKGAIEWVKINQPEVQPDGSTRYINDITMSMADFLVSEQDYAGTLRQVMFESLNQLATRLPPEVSLRIMTIAMEFSDLPNKDEIADALRKMTGDRDPSKELTPEEQQQMQQQAQQQAEALQLQRESAMAALEEQRAKVREINAKAAKLESESMAAGQGGMPPELQAQMQQIQSQAADQIDALSQQLSKAQAELANRTFQINADKDTKLELAAIDRDTKLQVAEIQRANDKQLDGLVKSIDALVSQVEDARKAADEARKVAEDATKRAEKIEKTPPPAPAPVAAPAAAPAPAPATPTVINLNLDIDAGKGEMKKSITFETDADGKITGATAVETAVEDKEEK